MEKIFRVFLIIFLLIFTSNYSSATFFKASTSKNKVEVIKNINNEIDVEKIELEINSLVKSNEKQISFNLDNLDTTPVNLGDVIESFASYYEGKIPESYKYIEVNILGIKKGTKIYDNVQKLIYVNLLPNKNFRVNEKSNLSAYSLYKLTEKLFKTNLVSASQIKYLKSRKANVNDLKYLKKVLNKTEKKEKKKNEEKKYDELKLGLRDNSEIVKTKQKIFNDVYKTIVTSHYNKNNISDVKLIEGATKGLAHGTGDKFTTYFPPVENKDFMESLDGKFEGIGSYVEMEKPGVLMIISPISGSPSEKAGLKGGDRILKANGKEIKPTTSLDEAISWIKGPKGTKVKLTILRSGKILEIDVIRDTIIIKNVESKKLNSTTYYIKLVTFGANISGEFTESLKALKKEKGIKKIIFDLRNNPGGYLHEVSDMLGHFVPKGKETAVVKYLAGNQNYYSKGYDLIDFSKYKIVILQNSGSASASEIFIGTLKDYFPKATIIGEQSYGKGSVQTIKSYSDGSSLKYTIAKWFTGKSQTGIDGIGITPDINLKFDFEKYKKLKIDNQLEKAKIIK